MGAHKLRVPPLAFGAVTSVLLVSCARFEPVESRVMEQAGLCLLSKPLVSLGPWLCTAPFPAACDPEPVVHITSGGAEVNRGWRVTLRGNSICAAKRQASPVAGETFQ